MPGARDLYEQFVSRGVERVREAVHRNEAEGLFLDFKESKVDRGIPSSRLTADGKIHLSRLISAYANISGGVIAWGVEAKDHKANADSPIPHVNTFLHDLATATATACDPPVPGVEHHAILLPDSEAGYAVTYVPESRLKPHQCVVNDANMNYYQRSGGSVRVMPHALVRALFAERAGPKLAASVGEPKSTRSMHTSNRVAQFEISVENVGDRIAKHVAVAVRTDHGKGSTFRGLPIPDLGRKTNLVHTGQSYTVFVLQPTGVLHPGIAAPIVQFEQQKATVLDEISTITLGVIVMADGFAGEEEQFSYEVESIKWMIGD